MKKITPGVIFFAAAIAGCRTAPRIETPQAKVPPAWQNAEGSASAGDIAHWWKRFEDPLLDRLVAHGLSNNLDLREAAARIQEARELRNIAGAGDEIQIDANASGIRKRSSANNAFVPPTSRTTSQWQAGFDAIWEFDVFGRIGKEKDAAQAGVDAAIEGRRDLQVTLVAEIARYYIELLGALERWKRNQQILAIIKDTTNLVRARADAGLATDFELSRAEALVGETKARLLRESFERKKSLHRLALLLGTTPEELANICGEQIAAEALDSDLLRRIPETPGTGAPSDLLRRRPDIRRAEREIAQTAAEIGIATAELFPRFSLTGALGLQASSYRSLNNTGSGYWSIGPSMSWPILDTGKLHARIRAEEARHAQALARYEKRVLTAIEEAENAMSGVTQERERVAALSQASTANNRAFQVALELYGQGLTDFLTVLDANRAHVESSLALADAGQSLALQTTALFKALGGGWDPVSP